MQIALATLDSKAFISNFVEKYDLYSDIGSPVTSWEIHEEMSKRLQVEKATSGSLYSISIILNDPLKASSMTNAIVSELNDFLREKEIRRLENAIEIYKQTISNTENKDELEMLYFLLEQSVNKSVLIVSDKDYVFRVIDPSQPPETKYWPNYILLIIIGLGIFSILTLVYFLYQSPKIREIFT